MIVNVRPAVVSVTRLAKVPHSSNSNVGAKRLPENAPRRQLLFVTALPPPRNVPDTSYRSLSMSQSKGISGEPATPSSKPEKTMDLGAAAAREVRAVPIV